MFGSDILEIALGLTLVYTMFSLVCTAGNELIASVFRLRARNLADGIRNLLNHTGPPGRETAGARGASPDSKTSVDAGTLAQQLYDHPLIQSLYRRGPDSILHTFAHVRAGADGCDSALQSAASDDDRKHREGDRCQPRTRRREACAPCAHPGCREYARNGAATESRGTRRRPEVGYRAESGSENIEVWFNDSMDRYRVVQAKNPGNSFRARHGVYRDAQRRYHSARQATEYDSALRQSLVAQAEKLAEQPPAYIVVPRPAAPGQPAEGGSAHAATGEAGSCAWPPQRQAAARLQTQVAPSARPASRLAGAEEEGEADQSFWVWWLTKLVGLLLTAGAASLGAPFWFDFLNKIVTIQSAGKPGGGPKQPRSAETVAPGQSPPEAIRRRRPAAGICERRRPQRPELVEEEAGRRQGNGDGSRPGEEPNKRPVPARETTPFSASISNSPRVHDGPLILTTAAEVDRAKPGAVEWRMHRPSGGGRSARGPGRRAVRPVPSSAARLRRMRDQRLTGPRTTALGNHIELHRAGVRRKEQQGPRWRRESAS